MKESFAEKVEKLYNDGKSSNPQFERAVKYFQTEIEKEARLSKETQKEEGKEEKLSKEIQNGDKKVQEDEFEK